MKSLVQFRALLFLIVIISLAAAAAFTPGGAQAVFVDDPTATPTPEVEATALAVDLPLPTATLEASGTPLPQVSDPDSIIGFNQIPFNDSVMRGPIAALRLRVGVPPTWKIVDGSKLVLVISPFYSSTNPVNENQQISPLGANLTVSFNGKLAATVLLNWTGDRTVEIPIPTNALVSTRSDSRHEILLYLDAMQDCDYNTRTTLTVRSTSRLILPHEIVAPTLDLAVMPRPFYQEGLFLPAGQDVLQANATVSDPVPTTLLVVPDQPSPNELQAAFITSATFGNMTFGRLVTALVPESKLTREQLTNSDLVFVGKAVSFSSINNLQTPSPRAGDTFADTGSMDDGVMQLAHSPWNPQRVVLLISGGSDAAVVKAAQAFSSRQVFTAGRPDLSVVKAIQDLPDPSEVPVDRTFASLGFEPQSISAGRFLSSGLGAGLVAADIRFYIPPGLTTTEDAYAEIHFSNSATMDINRSSLSVYLNDQPIGGSLLANNETNSSILKVRLPAYALRPNLNRLEVIADLYPIDLYCTDDSLAQLWVSIDPNSNLHIPLVNSIVSTNQFFNLGSYPYSLTDNPTLRNLAILTSNDDPVAWNTAAQIAADLGNRVTGGLLEMSVYFGDLPENVRNENDVLIVGHASRIPFVQEINNGLPAPFDQGSDRATERSMRVVYRVPDNASLGYLQLLVSPWNANRTIVSVLGTTDEGLNWAGRGLTVSRLRAQLAGNFAVVKQDQILTADTRAGMESGNLSATAVMGAAAEVQPGIYPTAVPPTGLASLSTRKDWILPVFGIASLLALIILILGVRSSRKQSES